MTMYYLLLLVDVEERSRKRHTTTIKNGLSLDDGLDWTRSAARPMAFFRPLG
jgi:hypothetical protein